MSKASSTEYTKCPTTLSEEQFRQYREEGFLAFVDVLSAGEVEEARAAITELVNRFARTMDRNGSKFWVQFEKGFDSAKGSDSELEMKVRKLMSYQDHHPFFHYLAHEHPRIRGLRDSILGKNSILFQDMALIKPPFIGSEKPWHQDDAYFQVTPLESICGVWIALDDAAVENGCMHVIPGGHKLGPLKHFHGPAEGQAGLDCQITSGRIDVGRAVPVELPPGGGMFFQGLLPHETPPNRSAQRRRALQFHYRSKDTRLVTHEEYDREFAEADGTPASCYRARSN